MKTRLATASFVLAAAAAVFVLVCPVYTVNNGETTRFLKLLDVNGSRALIPVFFPVTVAVMPLVFRNQKVRIIAAIIMSAFAYISGLSIGLLYFPAAFLMILAASVADSARFRDILRT